MMQLIEIPSSKRSSSEARLLLREYSHRIDNEFASSIGAISVAAAHTPSTMKKSEHDTRASWNALYQSRSV